MKHCSVFMDVEDPLNPLADDAARDLAEVFTHAGVRGSFCITGEKCRTLLARGRFDVLDAHRPHCLGLHTDTHSFHPTTMELLAPLTFEEGCEAAFETEHRGAEAFRQAFQRTPAFWGGAGNTWSPEITHALTQLGIPAYAYAQTSLPDEAVHRFNGIVGLPQALSISETDWADDERASMATSRVIEALRNASRAWTGIFVGHPTRFRYSQFWDVGYAGGSTPAEPVLVDPVSDKVYERSKDNLATFLERLRVECVVVGVDEALSLPWTWRRPSVQQLAHFRQQTTHGIRSSKAWPIHHPQLDVEPVVSKTLALEGTLEVGILEA